MTQYPDYYQPPPRNNDGGWFIVILLSLKVIAIIIAIVVMAWVTVITILAIVAGVCAVVEGARRIVGLRRLKSSNEGKRLLESGWSSWGGFFWRHPESRRLYVFGDAVLSLQSELAASSVAVRNAPRLDNAALVDPEYFSRDGHWQCEWCHQAWPDVTCHRPLCGVALGESVLCSSCEEWSPTWTSKCRSCHAPLGSVRCAK